MSGTAEQVVWEEREESVDANSLFAKLKPLTDEQKSKGYYFELKAGDAVEGVIAGTEVNKFGKLEYRITSFKDGKTIVLANAGNLQRRIEDKGLTVGDAIRIEYNGKKPMKSGQYKGTLAHNFTVLGEA